MSRLPTAAYQRACSTLVVAVLLSIGVLAQTSSPASAATTFGSSLAHSPNDGSCGGPNGTTCGNAISNIAVDARAPGGLNAPADGVIVRWRLRGLPGGTTSTLMSLRVYRGNTVAGVSADVQPVLSGEIETFDTRIPVESGDRLGQRQTLTGLGMTIMPSLSYTAAGSGVTDYWASPPAPGATAAPTHADSDRELLINADVEADADADGYGDETQDLCPTDPTVQTACPSAPTNPVDNTKPVVGDLKLIGNRGFSFSSTEAGAYSVHVDRVFAGRERSGKCSRASSRGPRCKIYRRHKRKTDATTVGANTVSLSTKRLPPGRYCIRVIVTDTAGNASEAIDREFTVRRKRR